MQFINWFAAEPRGQTALQLAELTLALVLSSLIGFERELRLKSAGLRTHTLVGVAAALITLISKYGFSNVLAQNLVVLDPSRVAAQVVSGIGFIGGGLIFVQRDVVRGLTTAATIWLTAAVGMACGGGLPMLALYATAIYFLVMFGYAKLSRHRLAQHVELLITYRIGQGVVREIMKLCAGRSYSVHGNNLPHNDEADRVSHTIRLRLSGRADPASLKVAISDIPGVTGVSLNAAQDTA